MPMQSNVRICLAVGMLASLLGAVRQTDPLIIQTEQGKIRGTLLNAGAVHAYLGVPYAVPPLGPKRWTRPEPALPWQGVLDATRYGDRCMQNDASQDMAFQDAAASEDCLSLNVFAPASATAGSKLPVMFWIHGGGYSAGASSEPRHNGDFLPGKGVVLVTINYRLGLFGFLALPEFATEQNGGSGNYGLMDMVAALRWVKSNIPAFGGDPARITIFGESAGSFAVSTLMALPSARGLFQRAIGESGSALALNYESLDRRGPKDALLLQALAIKTTKQLRAVPVSEILDAASKAGMTRFVPVIDGLFIPEPLTTTYLTGRQMDVPLLVGFNRDEAGGTPAVGTTREKWLAQAEQRFGARAKDFLALYPSTTDSDLHRSVLDYDGDSFIAYGTWKWMEYHRKTAHASIYRYRLDFAAPPSKYHPHAAAFHSDDIEYVFGTLDTRPGAEWRGSDRKLSDQIMSYWTNFAKRGDPNGSGLPMWPQYSSTDPVLHLDDPISVRPDENRARYEFLLQADKTR